MAYPATINSLTEKSDGPSQLIYAAHMNAMRTALLDIVTAFGSAPQGNLASIEARLDVNIDDDGKLMGTQQCVFVAKGKTKYSTIQSAIDSISDASITKPYIVLVFPGKYIETVTMKAYVDVVGFSSLTCRLYAPTDQNALIMSSSYILNFYIRSAEAAPCVSCPAAAAGKAINCYIYSSGDDCISIDGGSPIFENCEIVPNAQLYIDHNSGNPEFRYCTITPIGGDGGASADDMIIFYHCFIGVSDNQYTVATGATGQFRFCILGETIGGTGTITKGTMTGSCTAPD